MTRTELSGAWTLNAHSPMKSSGIKQGSEWDMDIPGSIHDTLLAAGLIEEPYDGTGIINAAWVGESAWSIKRNFTISRSRLMYLTCPSLSPAAIIINGKEAGRTKGEGSSLSLDISNAVSDGDNHIEFIFSGTGLNQAGAERVFPGIWGPVDILSDDEIIFSEPELETISEKDGWKLCLKIKATAYQNAELPYEIAFNGKTVKGVMEFRKGTAVSSLKFDAEGVSLWWPQGTGPQPLYPVSINIAGMRFDKDIAFRTIQASNDGVECNGMRIFAKGAVLGKENLIPSRNTSSDTERLLRSAAEAGLNTLITENPSRKLEETAARNGMIIFAAESPATVFSSPSFPSKWTMERIWKDDVRNIASSTADLHGGGTTGEILSSIAASFLFPDTEGKLVYLSQIKAAEMARKEADRRRARGEKGLILSSLVDPWPAISDSAIEYGGKWKLLSYASRAFFSPLQPILVTDGRAVGLYFANDTLQEAEAEFSIKLRDFSGGKKETREYSAVAGPGEIVKVAEYPLFRVDETNTFLYVKMSTKDLLRERTMLLDKPKNLKLENPCMKVSITENSPRTFAVKLTAEKPAFHVALDSNIRGLFSDNMISVRPSAEKTVFFKAEEDTDLQTFSASLKVMDLYSAMH